MKVFPKHFELTEEFKLPLYLYSRNTKGDFLKLIQDNRSRFPGGVVISFTESAQDLQEYLKLGLYIGVNGVSMRKEEQLEVLK